MKTNTGIGKNKIDSSLLLIVITVVIALAIYGQIGNGAISPGISRIQNTSQISGVDAYASGRLTFTGNVTCGEFVNITAANGTVARFRFNLTSDGLQGWACGIAPDSGQTNVSVPLYIESGKTYTNAAANLSTAINANGTLLATMTAASPSNTALTLTYNSYGSSGNLVTTTEALTNASWSAGTLQGGSVSGYSTWDTNTQTTYRASGSNVALVWFIVPFVIIMFLIRR